MVAGFLWFLFFMAVKTGEYICDDQWGMALITVLTTVTIIAIIFSVPT